MQENYLLVQQGFRVLLPAMSSYIGQEFCKEYKDKWWSEILATLRSPRELPEKGDYAELVDSLDVASCLKLINFKWNEVFSHRLSPYGRYWARELLCVRNVVSHIGQQDLEQRTAERALDTMVLLCKEIDPDAEQELLEYYEEACSRSSESVPAVYEGLAQPESDSARGALKEGSLLDIVDTDIIQKTNETTRVTYGGKTVVYPVYRVRLDALFYNDQNDRIATWISRYEAENGEESLSGLNQEIYNRVIEEFICESNPDAINKTKNNIARFKQRDPGVTLADGRIVDGNRRFTCLRMLQREENEPMYFETAIMDMDIREDKKQIKLLELGIQHGEEKKVDYDLIDYAVGTYRDIVETKLLTIEEYAANADESEAEVKKRIEIAQMICEFLEHIKLEKQYHVAKDYQVYSLIQEMMPPLRQLDAEGKAKLKTIAFNNAMMKAIPDQRKFIRDIKGLIKNNTYDTYFEEQDTISEAINEKFTGVNPCSKEDIDKFAEENHELAEKLQTSMERALLKSRAKVLKAKPIDTVSKCITMLTEVDPRFFNKMDEEEKETLRAEFDELANIVSSFKEVISRGE